MLANLLVSPFLSFSAALDEERWLAAGPTRSSPSTCIHILFFSLCLLRLLVTYPSVCHFLDHREPAACRPWKRPTPAGPAGRPHTKFLPGFIHALRYFKISHHFYLVFAFFFHRALQLPTSWQTGSRSTCVLLFLPLALACLQVCLLFCLSGLLPHHLSMMYYLIR